jgi:hypothetical protein
MPKTLREVLLQSGLTEEQIDTIDAKALAAGDSYYTTVETAAAEKERLASEAAVKAGADRKAAEAQAVAAKAAQDAAELSNRSVKDFWDNTYNPGVAAWEAERVKLAKAASDAAAEAAFYKAQREGYLGTLGIKPEDAPVFTPAAPVNPAVDPNKTPGTPTFTINDVRDQLGTSLGTVANIQWEYQTLYGKPMPISPTELLRQSEANKFKDPATYANTLFKFAEKREEMRQAEAKAHDEGIAAAARADEKAKHDADVKRLQDEFAAKERLRAEQHSNNPDVRQAPGSAKFSDLQRATKAGERPDPTKMSQAERRALTSANIHKAIEERQTAVA